MLIWLYPMLLLSLLELLDRVELTFHCIQNINNNIYIAILDTAKLTLDCICCNISL